ncbi:MAG: hypothetical protein IKP88_11550 [Lachnospiraceae bacterium]|nr:hypothetical protein [Lachnospiraceae bacterium]
MKKDYSPVLPFDGTLNDNFVVYDEVKYECKVDRYQTESPIRLHHKSVVKYYNCAVDEKPVRLGGG